MCRILQTSGMIAAMSVRMNMTIPGVSVVLGALLLVVRRGIISGIRRIMVFWVLLVVLSLGA